MYDWHDEYGYITCAQSPFNIVLTLMTPCEILGRWCGYTSESINKIFTIILYIPNAVIVIALFTFANAVLIPIAYVTHLLILTATIFDQESCKGIMRRCVLTLKFMFGGLLYLMISLVWDTLVFSYNMFTVLKKDELNIRDETKRYTVEGITLFSETCDEVLELLEKEDKENNKDSEGKINFVEFNKLLQEKFGVVNEIRRLIFDHTLEGKFVYNSYTNKTQLAPKCLSKINQYNSIKELVIRTSNETTGLVDVNLIKRFLDQVLYVKSVHEI